MTKLESRDLEVVGRAFQMMAEGIKNGSIDIYRLDVDALSFRTASVIALREALDYIYPDGNIDEKSALKNLLDRLD